MLGGPILPEAVSELTQVCREGWTKVCDLLFCHRESSPINNLWIIQIHALYS